MSGCSERGNNDSSLDLGQILPQQISGWVRSEPAATYDRETIFEYINGAGEVYRSYGFGEVLVERYMSPDSTAVTIELFDMGNSDDAYGVFSYARESELTGIGGGYELRGRVLCFWQDRFYVCLSAEERTADSDRDLTSLAQLVSQRLPPATALPDLLSKLPTQGLVRFSERFFHLHQSLNYHYYLARDNLFNLSDQTDAVIARFAPGSSYLLIIEYRNEDDALSGMASFKRSYLPDAGDSNTVETENGNYVSYGQEGRYLTVVFDAATRSAAENLLQQTLDNLVTVPSEG